MLLKIALLLFVSLSAVSASPRVQNCLDDNKHCVGLPRGCLGDQCAIAYSSVSNGTHTEIEIFIKKTLDKSWIAMAYSDDQMMENDFVVFCVREDTETNMKNLAGLANNTKYLNHQIGTISQIEKAPKKDTFKLNLEILEHSNADENLYCRLRHRVDPIRTHFNRTKVDILMAKGNWIHEELKYHGKNRWWIGQVELNGEKKEKKPEKKAAASSLALFSSAVTFLAAKLVLF